MALFSTNLGQREPRLLDFEPYLPPYPPIIVRSDKNAGVQDFAQRLFAQFPTQCRDIYPGAQMHDFFDSYDIHLESAPFLVSVLEHIGALNIQGVTEFAVEWSLRNKHRLEEVCKLTGSTETVPLRVVDQIFKPYEIDIHGRPFLWHALNQMKLSLDKLYQQQQAIKVKQETSNTTENKAQANQLTPKNPLPSRPLTAETPSQITIAKRSKSTKNAQVPTVQPNLPKPDRRRTASTGAKPDPQRPAMPRNAQTGSKKVRNGPHSRISSMPETPVVYPVMHVKQPSSRQASAHYNASSQGKLRQSSAGYDENVGPRHPSSDLMTRQASYVEPSPGYPATVERVRVQEQIIVPTLPQNYRNVTGVLPNPMNQQSVPNQLIQPQQCVTHMPYQAIMPNGSMMVGPPPDLHHMYNGNPNALTQSISEMSNFQHFSPGAIIRQIHVSGVGPQEVLVNVSGHAPARCPDRESRLYNPYGPDNPEFSQGPSRGRRRGKPSFSTQSGRARKFSSGSYGCGSYGQYTGDRGPCQGPYQGSYRGPRLQDPSLPSVPHQQEHRNTTAILNEDTEPFPPFDASQQPLDSEKFHFQASCYKALGPHPPGLRKFNSMLPHDSEDFIVENLDPEHGCGKDWIGPSCEKVRCLWVHGISKDVTVAAFKQFFEHSAGVPVIDVGIQEDKNRHRYAFIHFNTSTEARKALQLNGTEFNGRVLFVQVPQKFYTPPTFDKPWNQRQLDSTSNRRMSLLFARDIRRDSVGSLSYRGNLPVIIQEAIARDLRNTKQYIVSRRPSSIPQINSQEEHTSSFEHLSIAAALPTYSPQDVRSNLLPRPARESPAMKGSPELKRPKGKSAKSSPKKSKQAAKDEKTYRSITYPTKPCNKSTMLNKEKTSEVSKHINADALTKAAENGDVVRGSVKEKSPTDGIPQSVGLQIITGPAHKSPANGIQFDKQTRLAHVVETTALYQVASSTTKPLDEVSHLQTPIKDVLRGETPNEYHTSEVEVASEDDQKLDASFHSAKESQSPKSGGKGDVESFTEDAIMISKEDQPITAQGSDADTEAELEQNEQVLEPGTLKTDIGDNEIITSQNQQPVGPPCGTNKALAASELPPKSGVKQTESLHPFAKPKQQKQPQSKKGGKKKGKGKEVELPKPRLAESSTPKQVESAKPKAAESAMLTQIKADWVLSSISEVWSNKGNYCENSQYSKVDVTKEDALLEPLLESSNESTPPSKGKQELEPIDGKNGSFSQLGEMEVEVAVPFLDQQDVPVTKALQEDTESLMEDPRSATDQNLEATKREGEKEKKRKAIAAKVAIPHIKLRSTPWPSATIQSDGAEARSQLTQTTHASTSEDKTSPRTENKNTCVDIPVSEPMEANTWQKWPDPPSRSNKSVEQHVGNEREEFVSAIRDSLQPVYQPLIKCKKSKMKKNKTATTQEGAVPDIGAISRAIIGHIEETKASSAIDDRIDFSEQKMTIDNMSERQKSSTSYYDKTYLGEKSPKSKRASQLMDRRKSKGPNANEDAKMSSPMTKIDSSTELGELCEELNVELACQGLFNPESTERKNSIAKIQMLRTAIDAGQNANTSSRAQSLDPEAVKAALGYKMTGVAASKRLPTSKQSQSPKTPPISLVKDYYTVKENEYIDEPMLGKSVASTISRGRADSIVSTETSKKIAQ